jgi:hypothetical protein
MREIESSNVMLIWRHRAAATGLLLDFLPQHSQLPVATSCCNPKHAGAFFVTPYVRLQTDKSLTKPL